MKKLLLVAVVAGGLMFAGTTRSDAQVYFSLDQRCFAPLNTTAAKVEPSRVRSRSAFVRALPGASDFCR
jgi:hypothetical protein